MITMEFIFVDETGRDITARAEGAGYVWADYFRDSLEGLAAAQSVEQADKCSGLPTRAQTGTASAWSGR